MTMVWTYAAYLLVTIPLIVWVARTLFKNGRVFLVDVFHGNETLADSVNQLLVVGFYLVNMGYVCLMLKMGQNDVFDARTAIEALATKIGMVLLALGAMHFFNLYLFNRIRTARMRENGYDPRSGGGRPNALNTASFIEAAAQAQAQANPWSPPQQR